MRNYKLGLTFEIADDFTARLCAVDEGHQLPDAATCEANAREAIAFYQTALLPKTNNPYDDIPF